ncbi:hypothetical protein INT48_003830 [Thamnidium elegans]|uniref:Uncharacterized protein n=1 Tax=Thamnidium elegans TaxID=101142 RepID=A0A8H7VVP4_9FUNG|nr:hypothetical protein INT48_003830 [Thamnidium elegans]
MLPHYTETTLSKRRKVNLQSLPGAWIDEPDKEEETSINCDQDIDLLKQTIANLRKEKKKLEETNDIVKKSIQIVARKRLIAQTKKKNQTDTNEDGQEEEDIYIVVPSDFMPTQEEMKAAGLDGWEWISAYF